MVHRYLLLSGSGRRDEYQTTSTRTKLSRQNALSTKFDKFKAVRYQVLTVQPNYILSIRYSLKPKVKRWKKINHENSNQRKAGVTILISGKVNFRTKKMIRDTEGHYIMIKASIHQEDSKTKCGYTK